MLDVSVDDVSDEPVVNLTVEEAVDDKDFSVVETGEGVFVVSTLVIVEGAVDVSLVSIVAEGLEVPFVRTALDIIAAVDCVAIVPKGVVRVALEVSIDEVFDDSVKILSVEEAVDDKDFCELERGEGVFVASRIVLVEGAVDVSLVSVVGEGLEVPFVSTALDTGAVVDSVAIVPTRVVSRAVLFTEYVYVDFVGTDEDTGKVTRVSVVADVEKFVSVVALVSLYIGVVLSVGVLLPIAVFVIIVLPVGLISVILLMGTLLTVFVVVTTIVG
ncbi:unnamed protein product [Caretta caretta]